MLLSKAGRFPFDQQYTFKDCHDVNLLKFDFAIENSGIIEYLIEFDGQQHFKPVDFAGKGMQWAIEQFKNTQRRDKIKNQYCIDNNILLIRIPYWEFKNIEEKLSSVLINYNKLEA